MEDRTRLSDIVGEEGGIKVNYTKLREKALKCRADKFNQKCRIELKDLGIEWIGD